MKKIYPPVGFHGDKYLLKLVDHLLQDIQFFVETGTNIAATLNYVAKTYPKVTCLSCEPDKKQYGRAVQNTKIFPRTRVKVYNKTSQDFFRILSKTFPGIFREPTMFWLDAHGRGFQWPLQYEVAYITKKFKYGYILVDDFEIPGKKCFQFDRYGGQKCCYEFVRGSIHSQTHRLYYPNYVEHTSKYHPLVGWGLIEFGDIPETGTVDTLFYAARA